MIRLGYDVQLTRYGERGWLVRSPEVVKSRGSASSMPHGGDF
jgi:hypothetical protein